MKLILLLGLIVIFGCTNRTKLSSDDLKWINVYWEGDTLIFQSEKGDLDTSVIVKKEVFNIEYSSPEQTGTVIHQWGVVYYKNSKLRYHPDGFQMINIEKKEGNITSVNINYLYTNVLIMNSADLNLDRYKHNGVYEFDIEKSGNSDDLKKIFWSKDLGLIKYISSDGTTWKRVNLPRH